MWLQSRICGRASKEELVCFEVEVLYSMEDCLWLAELVQRHATVFMFTRKNLLRVFVWRTNANVNEQDESKSGGGVADSRPTGGDRLTWSDEGDIQGMSMCRSACI